MNDKTKEKTLRELIEEKSPDPGFFTRWNVGETYPEEDRREKENKNVVSFEKAKRIREINEKRKEE